MKKIMCIFMCFIFALSLAACGKAQDDGLSGEFTLLELAQRDISPDIGFKILDKEGNVCLDHNDIKKVFVTFHDQKNRYLELRLTDDGAADFKKALKAEGAELSIFIGDTKIATPVIQDDIEENSAIVLGEYEYIMKIFNTITKP